MTLPTGRPGRRLPALLAATVLSALAALSGRAAMGKIVLTV